jgi:hypothetical protein
MRPSWRNARHIAAWEMTLRNYAAPLRRLPVDKIVTDDVLSVLRQLGMISPKPLRAFVGALSEYLMPRRHKDCGEEKIQPAGAATWINCCLSVSR